MDDSRLEVRDRRRSRRNASPPSEGRARGQAGRRFGGRLAGDAAQCLRLYLETVEGDHRNRSAFSIMAFWPAVSDVDIGTSFAGIVRLIPWRRI
jgi:hypothetical protein